MTSVVDPDLNNLALEKWLLRHPDAAPADRAAARAMLDDLRKALAGQ